jgi:alpha-tubulin suppressor-like RCC1 family protein
VPEGTKRSTPNVAAPVVEDDEAPSWANEPVEELSTSGSHSWMVFAGLALLLGGGMAAMFATKTGPFAPRPSASTLALSDKGTVDVPVLPQGASVSGDSVSPPLTAADSVTAMLRDSLRLRANADQAFRDSLTRAMQLADSLRRDSLALQLRRAERRATRTGGALLPGPVAAAGAAPSVPAPVAAPETRIRASDDPGVIAAGGRHSCAVVSARVLCWGANDRGQLGDGDLEARGTPAPVVGDIDFTQVSTGTAHSCGVARGGAGYCWGTNDRGQLGDATVTARSAPVRVAGNETFRIMRAGQTHTCGLTTAGEVLCWGANDHGQVGDGSSSNRTTPTSVAGSLRFVSLSVGWNHSCAIAFDGTVYCWGANAAGQLGTGSRNDARTPTAISAPATGGTVRFTSMAAGGTHSCAVAETGDAYCWGRNLYGQLGIGGTADALVPTAVATTVRFASVTAGGVHSCGRTRGGQAWCWGRNVYGQVGDGSNSTRETPSRVAGPNFTAINASGSHTCGVTSDDDTFCWGFNVEGQLGDGTRNHLPRPTRVALPAK